MCYHYYNFTFFLPRNFDGKKRGEKAKNLSKNIVFLLIISIWNYLKQLMKKKKKSPSSCKTDGEKILNLKNFPENMYLFKVYCLSFIISENSWLSKKEYWISEQNSRIIWEDEFLINQKITNPRILLKIQDNSWIIQGQYAEWLQRIQAPIPKNPWINLEKSRIILEKSEKFKNIRGLVRKFVDDFDIFWNNFCTFRKFLNQ